MRERKREGREGGAKRRGRGSIIPKDRTVQALKRQLHRGVIQATPVMPVSSSRTIVRDTQPVCEHVSMCTCVERVRMEGEEKDTTILLMALK